MISFWLYKSFGAVLGSLGTLVIIAMASVDLGTSYNLAAIQGDVVERDLRPMGLILSSLASRCNEEFGYSGSPWRHASCSGPNSGQFGARFNIIREGHGWFDMRCRGRFTPRRYRQMRIIIHG